MPSIPNRLLVSALILMPLLSGCFVAAVGSAAVMTGSSVNDRRGFGTVIDDKNIQLSAYHVLNRDKELVLQNRVMIAVYNGVMLLMGEVRTPELKQRAEQTVTGFGGVRRIVNEIDVMEPEGFWARRNDNQLTARVKLALTDAISTPGFDPTRVKVSTAHRTVYLLGIVTAEEDAIATELARNVNGVERVVKIFEYHDAQ